MARTHAINLLESLIKENNMDGISFELGNSQAYIKTIKRHGMVLLNNCQQYNMSKKNHELFEILQGAYTCNDKSMASAKVEKAHVRGNYNIQGATYVKDHNTVEALEEVLANVRDDLDFITDDDLKKFISSHRIKNYLYDLKVKYSYDLGLIANYHQSWNSDQGDQATMKDLIKVAPNRVATKGIWEKITKLECRAKGLMA